MYPSLHRLGHLEPRSHLGVYTCTPCARVGHGGRRRGVTKCTLQPRSLTGIIPCRNYLVLICYTRANIVDVVSAIRGLVNGG